MKNIVINILAFCLCILVLGSLTAHVQSIRNENKLLRANQKCLLDSIVHYKIADSLNAAQVKVLNLTLSQYKQYMADDAALIKKLKADNIKSVVTTRTETRTELVIKYDTVFLDSIKLFRYEDKWTDIIGTVYSDSVKLNIKNYEELIIVDSYQRKKFLFFKLPVKLFGYKHRQIDVVSKNPHTEIFSAEIINLEKQ